MNENIRIRKVKVTKKGLNICFEVRNDEFLWQEFSVVSNRNDGNKDLLGAAEALKPEILKLLETPESWGETLSLKGISYSYVQGIMGAVLTYSKGLKDADCPLNINTPHLPERAYGGANKTLSPELVQGLKEFSRIAYSYTKSCVKQLELNL